jgi:hypothetical protein
MTEYPYQVLGFVPYAKSVLKLYIWLLVAQAGFKLAALLPAGITGYR